MTRTYRLGALLERRGACGPWVEFVAEHDGLDALVTAINADVERYLSIAPIAWEARFFALYLAKDLGDAAGVRWWNERVDGDDRDSAVTPEERDRFIALWHRYADQHGLYEEHGR